MQVRISFDIHTATLAMCQWHVHVPPIAIWNRNTFLPGICEIFQVNFQKKKQEYPPAFRKDVSKCDLKQLEDCLKKLIFAIIFKACEM